MPPPNIILWKGRSKEQDLFEIKSEIFLIFSDFWIILFTEFLKYLRADSEWILIEMLFILY